MENLYYEDNITIFKTYKIENNTYSYWVDELPNHDKYDLLMGQQIIPPHISNYYLVELNDQKFLSNCYNWNKE
jgi:hypothetical protein